MKMRSLVVLALTVLAGTASAQAKLVLFTGTVVDSAKQPLANAEIAIEGMNLTRTTNDRGEFRFETVSAGVHRVVVRKIGYAQLDTSIAFREAMDVEWRVTMSPRTVTLDSVIVRAPMDPLMEEFEANRKRGFGTFRTREELTKMDGVSFPNVLRGLRGADIVRTATSASFITSKRSPITGCPPLSPHSTSRAELEAKQRQIDECLRRERIFYVPEGPEERMGYKRACYPQVFVDRQLMNSGKPTPPFDVGTYATEQIEAIEWYEGPSQTPAKFSIHNAQCGVLVLHIRKRN